MKEGPHLDRWHYLDYRDGHHDMNYIEWKYLNFIQDDLAGYMLYWIVDPEKKTHIGDARVIIRLFHKGSLLGTIKKIDMSDVQFDPLSASVVMGDTSLVEKDSHHYHAEGVLDDVSWDLEYTQQTPSFESFQGTNPGFLRWEKASWLVKMLRAQVRGSVTVADRTFIIDGLGYTDTNWGEFMPLFSRYEWGLYNTETFSFVWGAVYGLKKIRHVYFYFTQGDHLVALENAALQVEYLEWKRDEFSGVKMPAKSRFVFTEAGYEIECISTVLQHDTLGMKLAPLVPKPYVSEQLAHHHGTIKKDGVVIERFSGRGFQEWTTRTYKKIPVVF